MKRGIKEIIYAPSYAWGDVVQADQLGKKIEQRYEICPSQGPFQKGKYETT